MSMEAAVQQALSEALAGRIAERGTHEQLIARGGRYAELSATQFGNDAAAA